VLTTLLAFTARSVWMVSMVTPLTEHLVTARNVHVKVHEPQLHCVKLVLMVSQDVLTALRDTRETFVEVVS